MTRKEFSPFKIDNAKERFFNSKDEYLSFKQAWKWFHNTQPLAEYKEIDISPWDHPRTHARIMARTKVTALSAHHYMLYNLLRGYEITRGFAPLVRESRLNATKRYPNYLIEHNPWAACELAAATIIRAANGIRELKGGKVAGRASYLQKVIDDLKKPFNDLVTDEMIETIGQLLHNHIEGKDDEVGIPITRKEALTICQTIAETAVAERLAVSEREAAVGPQYDDRPFWKRLLGRR